MNLFDRLQETGTAGKIVAAIAAGLQAIVGDYFGLALGVLLVSNLFDWIGGRWAAREADRFSKTESRRGVMRKALAIMVVLIVRLVEVVLAEAGISTGGVVAIAVTVLLILEDAESIERHRMSIGAGRIPLLSWAIEKLRAITTGDQRTKAREEVAES